MTDTTFLYGVTSFILPLDEAELEGDLLGSNDISSGSFFCASCSAQAGSWKGLYGRDLNVVVHSVIDELCDGSYEALLIHSSSNDCVFEYGTVGEVAHPRL